MSIDTEKQKQQRPALAACALTCALAGMLLTLSACGEKAPEQAAGAPQVRVGENNALSVALPQEVAASMLTGVSGMPLNVLEAKALQVTLGEPGIVGPTDYAYYGVAKLSADELARYTASAKLATGKPSYFAPAMGVGWWPDEAAFGALQFYESPQSAGGQNAWIGVDKGQGVIYFSMSTS